MTSLLGADVLVVDLLISVTTCLLVQGLSIAADFTAEFDLLALIEV